MKMEKKKSGLDWIIKCNEKAMYGYWAKLENKVFSLGNKMKYRNTRSNWKADSYFNGATVTEGDGRVPRETGC